MEIKNIFHFSLIYLRFIFLFMDSPIIIYMHWKFYYYKEDEMNRYNASFNKAS